MWGSYTRPTIKMFPITGRESELIPLVFENSNLNPNTNQIQIESKSNPFVHLSSFLQGQPGLCGSYHLLQSCFSFFVHLDGQPEPFYSCIILQSCSSSLFCLHCQPELFAKTTFSSLAFLSSSVSISLAGQTLYLTLHFARGKRVWSNSHH